MVGRRMQAIALIACGIWLTGSGVMAEEKKDPQSAYEPRTKPGAGQAFLAKFVGDWTVAKTYFPRTGDPVKTPGACTHTLILDGKFLRSDFSFQLGDAKISGMGLIGYEEETGFFTSNWTDSRKTVMSLRQSQEKFNGEEIVMYSKSLAEGKESRKSRTVTRVEADGNTITHRQFAIATDGSERLAMELVMTRKKDK